MTALCCSLAGHSSSLGWAAARRGASRGTTAGVGVVVRAVDLVRIDAAVEGCAAGVAAQGVVALPVRRGRRGPGRRPGRPAGQRDRPRRLPGSRLGCHLMTVAMDRRACGPPLQRRRATCVPLSLVCRGQRRSLQTDTTCVSASEAKPGPHLQGGGPQPYDSTAVTATMTVTRSRSVGPGRTAPEQSTSPSTSVTCRPPQLESDSTVGPDRNCRAQVNCLSR